VNILLCSATKPELGSFITPVMVMAEGRLALLREYKSISLRGLFTGVGMTATAYQLGRILSTHSFDLAVNIGLAGSFIPEIHPGDVVEVLKDEWADTGAEDHDDFLNLDQLGLWPSDHRPFEKGFLPATRAQQWATDLIKVSGATVNTVHGSEQSIVLFRERSAAQVESMEGAAFFFACRMASVPCMQIRAISNRVEPRNRENWQIASALKALDAAVEHWWQEKIIKIVIE
jgi:futalosine hydrolase